MLFSTIGQLPLFLWMTGAGLLAGALYTVFAGLRRLLDAGLWLTLLIDALYGLCAAIILIAALLVGSYGNLRLYELLGAALGFTLHMLGPDPILRRAGSVLAQGFSHILVKIRSNRLIKVIFR